MGLVILPESDLGKELAKWNQPFYDPTKHPFPAMMYVARRRPDGVVAVYETDDRLFGGQAGTAERWTMQNCLTVNDEHEMQRALERGYRKTPQEALACFESKEKYIADSAAHRAYEDRNMSEKAKAEIKEAEDAAGMDHVPEIPEKRKSKKR